MRDGHGITTAITIAPADRAQFRLALPPGLTPSFTGGTGGTHDLAWRLVARTAAPTGGWLVVSTPLEIVVAGAPAPAAALALTPSLADERAAVAFMRFATEHGWHADTDAHTTAVALARDVTGGATLHLSYDNRGGRKAIVIARLTGPSPGLGLYVAPDTDGVEHVIYARRVDQARSFMHAVYGALLDEDPGELVRWTDHELVVERAVTDLVGDLATITNRLERVAVELVTARARIAPPPDLRVDVLAWRELAHELHGALAVGDLADRRHVRRITRAARPPLRRARHRHRAFAPASARTCPETPSSRSRARRTRRCAHRPSCATSSPRGRRRSSSCRSSAASPPRRAPSATIGSPMPARRARSSRRFVRSSRR